MRPKDNAKCTCGDPCCQVDVGVGIITCGSEHCYQHGLDAEFRDAHPINYDPDLREDEPPHDLTEIVWPVGVL